ncbi:GGDEF domain-containing protein [Alteromonas sp. D210916BOD_24]|uniref:GGDEF domain-containing protein n=1 Tax=Alteromonas sp. D210916BOD_24 TaxID=3157618 RepID=UPI00399C7D30
MVELIKQYLHSGVRSHYKDETKRRIVVVNVFAAFGITLTFVMGVGALFDSDYGRSAILLSACLSFIFSQRLQVKYKTARAHTLSITLLLICLMVLSWILMVTGGKDNTGPLWMYIVPPVTMFFAGFTRGLAALIAYICVCVLLLFVFDESLLVTSYPHSFKTRLLFSFLTVSALSAFYEYSRQKSYDTAKYLSDQFESQAKHDYLTQLLNRRGAQQFLEREYARLERKDGAFTVAIADIDRFKNINDTLGHEHGDEVLKQVSKTFTSRLRKQDVLARWGGEEFIFIFPDTDEANAVTALKQIKHMLNQSPLNIHDVELTVSSSFGVCEVTNDKTLTQAIQLADQALYHAKKTGRDKICTVKDLS